LISEKKITFITLNVRNNNISKNSFKLKPFNCYVSGNFKNKWSNDIAWKAKFEILDNNCSQLNFEINLSQCPGSFRIRKGGRKTCKFSDNILDPLECLLLLYKNIYKIKNLYKIDVSKKSKRNNESGKLYKP
jgi:hypothetical protein